MTILNFILWLLVALIIVLIMPIKYICDVKINTRIQVYLCIKYLFGVLKYEYPENKLKILGVSVIKNKSIQAKPSKKESKTSDCKSCNSNDKRNTTTQQKRYKKKEPSDKTSHKIDYQNVYSIILVVIKLMTDIIKNMWPKKINVKGEIGFDDPAHTGYLCGFDSVIRKYIDLDLKYNFNQKTARLNIFLSGKTCPAKLIFILIKYIRDKAIISFIKSNYSMAK